MIRIDRVGDVILSIPFLRSLYSADYEIDLVLTEYTREVLDGCPWIKEISLFDPGWGIREKISFIKRIRERRYDICIALSPLTWAYIITAFSRAKEKISLNYSDVYLSRLFCSIFIDKRIIFAITRALRRGERVPHEVEQMLEIARYLNIDPVERKLFLFLSEEEQRRAREEVREMFGEDPNILALHLSPKWFEGLNDGDLQRLLWTIVDSFPDYSLLVSYGIGEEEIGKRFQKEMEEEEKIRIVGFRSFKRWASFLSLCQVVITTDTSATHVAAALDVPVICIYGREKFYKCSQQWSPWMVKNRKLRMENPTVLIPEIIKACREILDDKKV